MTSEDILSRLYEWLGRGAVLLPLPLGQKRPDWPDWQSTAFERTQEPDYQDRLKVAIQRGGNIGVLLTAGLVSLDIDDDKFVDVFARQSPFSETLRSKGSRGCNFWLRMVGPYPNGQNVYKLKAGGQAIGGWRCGPGAQTVIWGRHPDSTTANPIRYQRIVAGAVSERAFSQMSLPDEVPLPWLPPG